HLFIFYFACMSTLTPPVAIASFEAAGIAGYPAYQTGNITIRISHSAYLMSYAFFLSTASLLQEGACTWIWTGTPVSIGTSALSAAVIGYQFRDRRMWERGLFFAVAVGLVYPHLWVSLGALASFALLVIYARVSNRLTVTEDDDDQKFSEEYNKASKEPLSIS